MRGAPSPKTCRRTQNIQTTLRTATNCRCCHCCCWRADRWWRRLCPAAAHRHRPAAGRHSWPLRSLPARRWHGVFRRDGAPDLGIGNRAARIGENKFLGLAVIAADGAGDGGGIVAVERLLRRRGGRDLIERRRARLWRMQIVIGRDDERRLGDDREFVGRLFVETGGIADRVAGRQSAGHAQKDTTAQQISHAIRNHQDSPELAFRAGAGFSRASYNRAPTPKVIAQSAPLKTYQSWPSA